MAHQAQRDFFERVKRQFPDHFTGVRVIDFGSLDINGSLKTLFTDSQYVGVDVTPGKNVDIIGKAHEYKSEPVDTVVSGEMLEHDPHWMESLRHMYDLLKEDGLLVVSAAGPQRPEHGTSRTPATRGNDTYGENPDYYRNITKEMMQEFVSQSSPKTWHVEYGRGVEGVEGSDIYFYLIKRAPRILAYICTCNRYDTTLPLALLSLINQTRKPDKIMIWDDTKEGQKKNPFEIEHYRYLFKLMEQKGIPFEYRWSIEPKGAHHNHERANMAGPEFGGPFDLAWFIDDDCVAEPTCLENLLKEMRPEVGAVGGLILQPPAGPLPPNISDNKIDDIAKFPNIQWHTWDGPPRPVEHIYSQFLYRCGIIHHDLRLSSVVFRGETMFTHSFLLKGYQLLVAPKAVTWHFQAQGGIHDGQKIENWAHDEAIFQQWLAFQRLGTKLYVLDGGLGDHLMFLSAITPEPGSIIACCYPDIFRGMPFKIISIAEAEQMIDRKTYDLYTWCERHNWKGHLIDAYRQLYKEIYGA